MLLVRVRCAEAYVSLFYDCDRWLRCFVELLACMNMANDSDENNCIGVSSSLIP